MRSNSAEYDHEYYLQNAEAIKRRSRQYYLDNRQKFLDRMAAYKVEIKTMIREARSRPCARCGGTYEPEIMELHHRDPSQKKGEVSQMKSPGAARLEIAKCDTLCPICHRREHVGLQGVKVPTPAL